MLFSSLFEKRSIENPSTPLSDPATWLFRALGARPSAAGVTVNEKTAYQITAFWSAVNIVADTLAELPIQLRRQLPGGDIEVIADHPVLPLIRTRPNPDASAVTLKSTIQGHTLTWGNGFCWIRRTASGPSELWPLLPGTTMARRDRNRNLFFEAKLETNGSVETAIFAPEDILHIPGLTHNGLMGLSPIRVQREMLGSAIAVQDFGARFFGNGAIPGGVMTFPDSITDPDELRNQMEDKFGGNNALRLLIISNGGKYEKIGIPPEDAQFLESKEFSVAEIARMFRLPLHFLGKMGQATFNNLEQMGTHFVKFTMMPWLVRWEQELTWKLLTQEERDQGFSFKFKADGLQRGDIKTRYSSYQSGINAGWLTRNDARRLEDMNPLEGLDEPLQPLNMAPISEDDGEEGEGGTNERVMIIIRAAAERVIRKEIWKIRALMDKHGDDIETFQRELSKFYRSHADMLVRTLAVAPAFAGQYCRAHELVVLNNPKRFDDVERTWRINHAVELANHAAICNGAGGTGNDLLTGPAAESSP